MRFIIDVIPGDNVTWRDLLLASPGIRAALSLAVGDVADNVYPEFTFGDVAAITADIGVTCTVCGGPLELSAQYPEAGYLHSNDADDTHVPVFRG